MLRSFRSVIRRLSLLVSLAVFVVVPLAQAMVATAEEHRTRAAAPEGRDVTVLVGAGQDTLQVFAFFPQNLRVRQGDTVTWRLNADEIHTVSFVAGTRADPAAGGIQNPIGPGGEFIPGFFVQAPPGAPGEFMLNPQFAFPTRFPGAPVETYSGTGYFNSGILMNQPPAPGAPPNNTFSLTFDTPGVFPFLCLVHPDRMLGTLEVVASSVANVPDQAAIDAQAQAEIAPLLTLVDVARRQGETLLRSDPGPGGTTIWFVRAGNSEIFAGDVRGQVFSFLPQDLRVRSGDTVVWGSTYFHSVTFNPTPPHPEAVVPVPQPEGPPLLIFNPLAATPAKPSSVFDPALFFSSADLGPFSPAGFSWALTFERPGTFEYFCIFHRELGMVGTITVAAR